MITILGSKISFFALYAMVTLQLIAVLGAIFGWKARNIKTDDEDPTITVLLWAFSAVSELILLTWLGSK